MPTQPLRFVRRGEIVTLPAVDTSRTLLDVLREDLHCNGTKEGCGEGDCGACTVVIGHAEGGQLSTRAVNSCIRLAHSIDGMALWTIEDIAPAQATKRECDGFAAGPPQGETRPLGGQRPASAAERGGQLHPAQQALVECHGSQCGFCTPGFVMSLFALYQTPACQQQTLTRGDALAALSGNLCRCTGYRPIVDAAQAMQHLPSQPLDSTKTLSKIELLTHIPRGLQPDLSYISPVTLAALLAARSRHPEAQLVAGCTDVGLWVTKQHRQFDRVLDLTRVAELRRIEPYPHHIAIGAAVPLADAFAALVHDRPQLAEFAHRFAGLPVRNSGTLGGNVANGSPIGDSMPLLIALGANVVLMRQQGKKIAHRELPLEDLYTGYRTNVMRPDEVLAWIKVPKAASAPSGGSAAHTVASVGAELMRVYKISKRFEDDISAVCLAIRLEVQDGVVRTASIGAGGVAATPMRARRTQAALTGKPWTLVTIEAAMAVLQAEFTPLSDMRASAAYRTQLLANLLRRFWLECDGGSATDLRQLAPITLTSVNTPADSANAAGIAKAAL